VGLALVKDLVLLHGGQVRAESPGEKQGATLTVELPLADAGSGPAHGALAGIRVLLVDDDRDICEVLQVVLEGQGAVVTLASSAVEALAALELSMPNVLLSDIAMPGESGYDLMRKIVAREGDGAPPAAALSAQALGRDLKQALASGFRMLLAKPIDSDALIAAVATLAGRLSGKDPLRLRVEGSPT
jgi:CheY-like chemotaxis protein